MKKGLSLLLALCMLAALLTGCRKEDPANLKEDIQQKTESAQPETQKKTEEPPKEQPNKTEILFFETNLFKYVKLSVSVPQYKSPPIETIALPLFFITSLN